MDDGIGERRVEPLAGFALFKARDYLRMRGRRRKAPRMTPALYRSMFDKEKVQEPGVAGGARPRKQVRSIRDDGPSEKVIQGSIAEMLRLKGWMVVRVNGGGTRRAGNYWVSNYLVYGYVKYWNCRVLEREVDGEKVYERIVARNGEGFPDLTAYKGDRFIFGEIKRKGGKLEASQRRFIEFAAMFGISVNIFDCWEDAYSFVQEL